MLRGVFQIFGEINEVSWILKVDHEPLIFIIVAGGWGQPWPPSFCRGLPHSNSSCIWEIDI
jgi:hypothetical protein